MSPQALIALLVVLILVTLSATPLARDFAAHQVRRVRQRVSRRPVQRVRTGTTVIDANGNEVVVMEEVPPPLPGPARFDGRQVRAVAAVVAAVLVGLLVVVQLYRILTTPSTGQFVVLVAPFQEADGTISQT